MNEVVTSIEINANRSKVWDILTDFRSYQYWNPVIVNVNGQPEEDSLVDITLAVAPGVEVPIFRLRIINAIENKDLRWKGPDLPGVGLIAEAEHYFSIEEISEEKVRFIHGEKFGGFLVPAIWPFAEDRLYEAYNRMNLALKERAEK